MKKIFVYIITLLPLMAFAQGGPIPAPFIINAKIGHLNGPARAYLFYQLGANKIVDSALIVQGSFSFNGNVMDPGQAYLVIDHTGGGESKLDTKTADALSFFIEKGTLTVTSATDSVAQAQITGSQVNSGYKNLMTLLAPVFAEAKVIAAEESAVPDAQKNSEAHQNAVNEKHKALASRQTQIFEKFVKDNPNNFISLLVISQMGPNVDVSELKPLYDGLGQNLKDMETGKQIKRSIDALLPTAIGSLAPDFTQNDVNGNPVTLSSFRGKYVLVDFWASWCGPCRAENPTVVKAYNRFRDKNFTVLGVSLDKQSGKDDWIAAIKNDGLVWTQVSDLNFWNNKAALLYGVQSIPHNLLLDPTGKIIAKDLRGADLDNKLTEIFGKL
jgi:peroxiredoxin